MGFSGTKFKPAGSSRKKSRTQGPPIATFWTKSANLTLRSFFVVRKKSPPENKSTNWCHFLSKIFLFEIPLAAILLVSRLWCIRPFAPSDPPAQVRVKFRRSNLIDSFGYRDELLIRYYNSHSLRDLKKLGIQPQKNPSDLRRVQYHVYLAKWNNNESFFINLDFSMK